MHAERLVDRWVGLSLVLVAAVASVWLTATGKLTLYVHPRYTFFTVVMSLVAICTVVAAVVLGGDHGEAPDQDTHHHPEGAGTADLARSRRLFSGLRVAVLVVAAFALLVVPPATLSASTRQNRDLVTSGQTIDSTDTTVLTGANPTTFTVKDWATLLRQGGAEAVVGKNLDSTGYVLDDGHDDVFYLVRLLVSCCAVDAQPVGVPVHRPGWRHEVQPSAWITVTGTFVQNIETSSDDPAVVQVASMKAIDEPDQPYVF